MTELVHEAACALCDWTFTHPDSGATDMQFLAHLIDEHDVDITEIHVESN